MSSCRQSVRLSVSPESVGLMSNVPELAAGAVKLRLKGHFDCRTNNRPFYLFDIVDATDSVVGEITFMPHADDEFVEMNGHSGGGLIENARGRGLYSLALSALAPLAKSHGMSEFVIAFEATNDAAVKAATRNRYRAIGAGSGVARYAVAVSEPEA